MHAEKEGNMIENSLRDKRILVVDDEPQLRRMIVDVLRCNYRPLLFSNPLFRGLFHF